MAISYIASVVVMVSNVSVIEVSMRCCVGIMLVMVVITYVMSLIAVVSEVTIKA